MSSFVIDDLGVVHHRANWEALRRRLPPAWLRVLGLGREVVSLFGIPLVLDPTLPPNSFELRNGTQRVRIVNIGWQDEAAEISRWEDDGGAP